MYLGLDLGTSGLKAVIINEAQQVIASAQSALTVTRPQAGWSEQQPEDWIQALEQVMAQLQAEQPSALAAVQSLALAGQMHGATLLDQHQQVLRPCILWNDTRSHREAAALDADPRFRAISGNIVFPGFTAPKLLWLQQHEPQLFARVDKVLLPKDYLRWWLTGEFVSDISDASGTAWLDVAQRTWSAELLAACDLSVEQMPRLIEGCAVGGSLHPHLAQRWGMSNRVLVAGGAGDNAAAACGMGVVQAGSAFVSLGTSGVLFAATDCYRPNPASAVHTFCHAVPHTWHQMGVILSATDALNWYAQLCETSAAALTQALGSCLKPPRSVLFLPYLAGERTPHNDATIRGAFIGLGHEHDRTALTQAVLEGVAFAIRDNLAALQAAGTQVERVTAVGGGSRSAYWLQLLASVLAIPVDVPAEGELGAAFGAARLALIAATQAVPLSVLTPPVIEQTFVPQAELVPAFAQQYQRYRHAYLALKGL